MLNLSGFYRDYDHVAKAKAYHNLVRKKITDKNGNIRTVYVMAIPKKTEHDGRSNGGGTNDELDIKKKELLNKVSGLVSKKKKLYSNIDIESPMSDDEKKLDKEIANIYSEINQIIREKRGM